MYECMNVESNRVRDLNEYNKINLNEMRRKNMPDDQRYVLVIVHSKTDYRIAGFIPGYKAKQEKYISQRMGREPFYEVPLGALYPIEQIESFPNA